MIDKEYQLLADIASKVKEKPEFLAHILNAITTGTESEISRLRQQCADMETMAVAMVALVNDARVSKQMKERMNELALSKLEKHMGECYIAWGNYVTKKR